MLRLSEKDLRRIRGNDVAMVFQDPMTSLNPVKRIGAQVAEVVRKHRAQPGLRTGSRRGSVAGGRAFPTPNGALRSIRTSFRAGCGSGR